ncbi:hypothetical protein FRUB_00209 [Fimbriiglobus ruber]|uniref:Uncharacterized protein n=1 Tax=Fimbriiglobus ruber TaxID=1908690 RepID=A0A225DYA0_9BACT|nr:hypothetical protein FRUB_00209 [Fimbriiglobus ruber]
MPWQAPALQPAFVNAGTTARRKLTGSAAGAVPAPTISKPIRT